jgi:hypothetical protein
MKFTKRQNKHLRELANKAYAIELSNCMKELHLRFEEWKAGKLTVFELSDLIHKFHDGDSRDLFKFYVLGKDYLIQTAAAIHNGHLSMDDVEESCRDHVRYILDNLFENKERIDDTSG